MQDATEIETEYVQLIDQIATFACEAEQEGRRYGQRRVAGRSGSGFVGVDRIGLANGLGEEAQAALFQLGGGHAERAPDQTLVCHFTGFL
ncbi:hypothetical protein D3C80_2003460 [compost metagenome]